MTRYELHQFPDPAFPIIFHEDTGNPYSNWSGGHWHEGVELLLGLEGSIRILQDGEAVSFGPGQMAVINSGKFHIFSYHASHCRYDCLILNRDFLETHGLPVVGLEFESLISNREPLKLFRELAMEMQEKRPFYKGEVLALALQLYTCLLRFHRLPEPREASRQPETVMRAVRYLREHLADETAIEDACRDAGVSRYQICRLFRNYLDRSPVEFLNSLRCKEARTLILSGKCNVAEAARQCGIENLSYFSRLYRRYMGVLPSQEKKEPPFVHHKESKSTKTTE